MSEDYKALLYNLRSMARMEHADLSIGDEAADTIDRIARERDEATARAERAESALRRIASTYDESYPVGCQERRIGDLARAALTPAAHEQEKRDG
jgi:hypothetical protein